MNDWAKQQINKLPKKLLDHIGSPLFVHEINQRLIKYELDEEEREALRDEVFLYILGATNPADFTYTLQMAGGLITEEAEELEEALNTTAFGPIADDIVNYWADTMLSSAEASAANTPSTQNSRATPISKLPSTPSSGIIERMAGASYTARKTNAVSDKDLEVARKALRDPYREEA